MEYCKEQLSESSIPDGVVNIQKHSTILNIQLDRDAVSMLKRAGLRNRDLTSAFTKMTCSSVETDLGNQDEAWLISSNELSERLNTKPIAALMLYLWQCIPVVNLMIMVTVKQIALVNKDFVNS